jgi:hypothetical protein
MYSKTIECTVTCCLFCRSPQGAKAASYIQDMELREEWQDEEFPRSETNLILTFNLTP